jgi:hypothetical protein
MNFTLAICLSVWSISTGRYEKFMGTLSGEYRVSVSFLDGSARSCSEYYGDNTTLVYSGSITEQTVPFWLFKQRPIDPTKSFTVQLSDSVYTETDMMAVMPEGTRSIEITAHEQMTGNWQKQVELTLFFNIRERNRLCPILAAMQAVMEQLASQSGNKVAVSIEVCILRSR